MISTKILNDAIENAHRLGRNLRRQQRIDAIVAIEQAFVMAGTVGELADMLGTIDRKHQIACQWNGGSKLLTRTCERTTDPQLHCDLSFFA